jgi:hypothetical protein
VIAMLPKPLSYAVAAVLAFGTFDLAMAKKEKPRPEQPNIMQDETPGMKRSFRLRPRGSSTYIPPPIPSPNAGPPAPALTQRGPGVYQPPRIDSFGDRATEAIHAYPLARGLGNNPVDQQMFIRQRANER